MPTELVSGYAGTYDPVTKIWSGPKWHRMYDRDYSMGRILFEEMRRRPKEICQISDSEKTQLTNEQVLQQAFRIVKYFEQLQLKQSDIVGLVCRNTTYLLGVILGCFFSGIAPHAISPINDEKTTRYLFDITKPKLIFCDGQEYAKISAVTSDRECRIVTLKQRVAAVPLVEDILNDSRYEPESDSEPADLLNGRDQTLAIVCSSGTSGLPKAVTIPNTTRAYEFVNILTPSDIVYLSSTFDWISGAFFILSSIVHGSRMIITDKSFTPEYFMELIQRHGVTFSFLNRTNLTMLVHSPNISADKLSSLKYFFSGGGKLSAATLQKLQSYLRNGRLTLAYSFTEFTGPLTLNENLKSNVISAGRLQPGFRIRIVDESGQNVGPGEVGEIYATHGEHWQGYYQNQAATDALFDTERWFHSGDIGYMDENMFLYIVDRKKDTLKYRSFHYWPSEIENVIGELPDIEDVSVFGVYSDLDGDAAAAAVVLSKGSSLKEADIINYVAKKFDAKHKHLNAGAIILKDLPKNNNGKIDRKGLLDIYMQMKGDRNSG